MESCQHLQSMIGLLQKTLGDTVEPWVRSLCTPHLTHWALRDMARVGAPRNSAFSLPLEVTKATTRIAKNTTELRKIREGGAWEGMWVEGEIDSTHFSHWVALGRVSGLQSRNQIHTSITATMLCIGYDMERMQQAKRQVFWRVEFAG